jgi:hypothetical protein
MIIFKCAPILEPSEEDKISGQARRVDSLFPVVFGLNDTWIEEVVVWHRVDVMGKSPFLEFSLYFPAFKVNFKRITQDNGWTTQREDGDRFPTKEELQLHGWQAVECTLEL